MSKGASVATVQVGRTGLETLKNIPVNIKEFKPYLILSVPALAKNFKKNIEQGIRAQGKNITRLFDFALKVAYIYNGDGGRQGTWCPIPAETAREPVRPHAFHESP